MSKIINIAKDFSKYPAGRFITDGEYSGEQFREDILIPALENEDTIIIELDGTLGYGSSFLDEAFGGLIRKGYTDTQLHEKIQFKTTNERTISDINKYISISMSSQNQ
jgi:hypothetical protein